MNLNQKVQQISCALAQAATLAKQETAYLQGGHDMLVTLHAEIKKLLPPNSFIAVESVLTAMAHKIAERTAHLENRTNLLKASNKTAKLMNLLQASKKSPYKCGDE